MGIKGASSCALLAALLSWACHGSQVSECASGRLCPAGSVCDDVNDRCVSDDQRTACDDLDEGDPCLFGSVAGTCVNGICEAPYCGDGVVNAAELCEGSPPDGLTCIDEGYDVGVMACNQQCSTDASACLRFGWEAVDAGTSEDLYSVWAAAEDDVYVLGQQGVRHFDGTSWTLMPGSPAAGGDRNEVWGRAPDDLYVATNTGLYHYDGAAWTHVWSDVELMGIGPAGDRDIYAVGWYGVVLHFDGTTWSRLPDSNRDLRDVAGTAPDDVYAVEMFEVMHYDGANWSSEPITMVVDGGSYSDVQVAGDTVFVSVPSIFVGGAVFWRKGTQWVRADIGTVSALHATSDDRALAVTYNGAVYHFDGWSWSEARGGGGFVLSGVYSSGNTAYAVGDRGLALRYDGAFLAAHTPPYWRIEDVWVVPGSGEVFAAGCEIDEAASTAWPTVYRFNGDGWAVSQQLLSSMGCLSGVWGSSADDVFVVAEDVSGSMHWDGSQWEFFDSSFAARDVWGWAPNAVVAVGFGSAAMWDGATWTTSNLGSVELDAVWGTSPNDIFAVGRRGAIMHFDGSSWTPMMSPIAEHLTFVWGSSGTNVYAGSIDGTVIHYDGTSWSVELELPGLSLHGAAGTSADDVFIAGATGSLLHFDGTRWSPVRTGSAADLIALHAGPGRILAAGDFATLIDLRRERFWHCVAAELCGDGMDNDCNGAIDDGC